jgi:hypothetical protein
MAYILQHRRDTLANWNSVNPVLADAEIGFILDLDLEGNQKSSLYKIGDGRTAWLDLPLFGFGGNVYNHFTGNDLNTSVASRNAVLNKFNEVINGTKDLDGLTNKISKDDLQQSINDGTDVIEVDKLVYEKQVVSRYALAIAFQDIWKNLQTLGDEYAITKEEVATLLEVAEVFGEYKGKIDTIEQFVFGWDEKQESENPEDPENPIISTTRHKGVDEKFDDVNKSIEEVNNAIEIINNKHQIISDADFKSINISDYPEGTLFYTYK